MTLSSELISQFAKITKDEKSNKHETTLFGTVVEYNNSNYVRLDGSDLLTPVTTTVDAAPGERVTVLLKNHSATVTGNISSPAVRTETVRVVVDTVSGMESVLADVVTTADLDAESARIDRLETSYLKVNDILHVVSATIGNLEASNVTITGKLNATDATIQNLESTNVTVGNRLTSLEGIINNLDVGNLDTETLRATYATIDFSNVGVANIGEMFVKSGIIKDMVVSNSSVTGELVGVSISGDLIKADTLVANKLVIQGQNGLYYRLNTDGVKTEAEQTEYNSLNGKVIIAKSITANKIDVDDLVAFDATIGGFNITQNSIYSGAKNAISANSPGVYFDNIGQINVGDNLNYIKYIRNTDGSYQLSIAASSVTFGSKAADLETEVYNAGKTASNYLNYSSAGLVVGNHTASTLGKNVLIDSEAVMVRTGTTVNAVFGGDIIELAKNNRSATISMLNGAFKIYYDANGSDGGFGIYGVTSNGTERLAFQPVNENDNLTLGWGGYAAKANSTNLYGHKMYLTTNEDIIINPGSGNIQMDGNVVLTNGKNLFGKRTDGIMRSLAILNASNQMLFGYGSYTNSEGSVFYDGNDITIRSRNDIRFTTEHETVMLQDGDGSATYNAFFKPISNAKCTLGTNANRWYAVYASNGTIQTSDIREKENIIALNERHSALFDRLRPVQYNFINGNGRACYGLIAQEVISTMNELGIGEHELDLVHHDLGDDDSNDTFGMVYSNLIALLIHEVQKLKTEVAQLQHN